MFIITEYMDDIKKCVADEVISAYNKVIEGKGVALQVEEKLKISLLNFLLKIAAKGGDKNECLELIGKLNSD